MRAIRITMPCSSALTRQESDTVHLFESAIDLLSYATMMKVTDKEYRHEHLLSLAGCDNKHISTNLRS